MALNSTNDIYLKTRFKSINLYVCSHVDVLGGVHILNKAISGGVQNELSCFDSEKKD